jgi:hypothetical protein
MKKYSKKEITFIVLTFLVVIMSAIYQYRNELFGGDKPPALAAENVSADDVKRVEDLTSEFLNHFKEGNLNDEPELNDITDQFLSEDFNENVFTDSFQKERWFGMFGLGSFYDKENEQIPGKFETRIKTTKGLIKTFEISDIQKDQKNNTITTYIRMDALDPNIKQWIEWRDIPGEGWKINAVSFSANIDQLETPISPKKEW